MNKEQYLQEKKKALKGHGLESEYLKMLDCLYIEANQRYFIGERVSIVSDINGHTYERKAYVDGFEINQFNDVSPTLRQIKKDGSFGVLPAKYDPRNSKIIRADYNLYG